MKTVISKQQAVNSLAKLDSIYLKVTTIKKRQIVGSMFPEKLTFDGENFRTAKLKEAVQDSNQFVKDLQRIV